MVIRQIESGGRTRGSLTGGSQTEGPACGPRTPVAIPPTAALEERT